MRQLLLCLTALLTLTIAHGQTNVSGWIYSDTTWTKANSPYIVTDTVFLNIGVKLTIQPGVTVKFANNKSLQINQGWLIANGTSVDSITFTSNSTTPTPGIWNAIYFNDFWLPAQFNYCNFQFADKGIQYRGGGYHTITIKNSTFKNNKNGTYCNTVTQKIILVDSCNFSNNTLYGIYNPNGGSISHSNISNNQVGFYSNYYSYQFTLNKCKLNFNQTGIIGDKLTIKNCVIDSNQTAIRSISNSTLDSCFIRYNQSGILNNLAGGNNQIKNCNIDSNIVVGISFKGTPNETVYNCQIKHNGIGIIDSTGTTPKKFTRNIIENNNIGVKLQTSNDNIYCNKICNNTIYSLKFSGTGSPNLANNYWCTSDSSSTSAVVFDGNDTASVGIIDFMPLDTVQCYQCNSLSIIISQIVPSCNTCSDGSATATASNGTQPYTYTWSTSPTQTTQMATGLLAGSWYNVCVTDSLGCSDCSSIFISNTVNINEPSNNLSFSIFPNPFTTQTTLQTDRFLNGASLTVYNSFGQTVKQIDNLAGQTIVFHRDNLPSGLYFICITQDNQTISADKLVIVD